MILHYHYSSNPNSGEIRRIRNINNDVCNITGEKCVEVEFYSTRNRRTVRTTDSFILSDNVVKKYYIPLLPFSGRFYILQLLSNFISSLILFFIVLKWNPSYIIGEYSISSASMMFHKFIKGKYIVDCHGALAEEYCYNNKNITKWKLNYINKMEKRSADLADYIICQSEEMKRLIIKKNNNINADKIFVYKCGVNTDFFRLDEQSRISSRNDLGLKDEILFVYSGGLMKWQKIEESLMFFHEYHKINNNSKFLILTRDTELLNSIVKRMNLESLLPHVFVKSVPFNKVSDYLNASDLAFLFRDNDIMNQVAFPTKLGEYLSCGLPVLTSEVATYWVNESLFNDHSLIICSKQNVKMAVDIALRANKNQIRKHAIDSLSLRVDSLNIRKIFISNQ